MFSLAIHLSMLRNCATITFRLFLLLYVNFFFQEWNHCFEVYLLLDG